MHKHVKIGAEKYAWASNFHSLNCFTMQQSFYKRRLVHTSWTILGVLLEVRSAVFRYWSVVASSLDWSTMAEGGFYRRSSLPRRTSRIVTMLEASDAVENLRAPTNLVLLPPASGDLSVHSDVEETPDDLLDEDYVMEPAGEMELEEDDEDIPDDVADGEADARELNVERYASAEGAATHLQPQAKRIPSGSGRWMKRTAFNTILPDMDLPDLANEHPELMLSSALDLWRGIYTPALMEEIVDQTLLYDSRDKDDQEFHMVEQDLERFLGIMLLSGYHTLPSEYDYWSNQPDLGVDIVRQAMSRNRFLAIKRYLHFADNQALEQGNKVAKIKPLYDSLNTQIIKWGVFHEPISIDESMVPYYGRHSAKMFIKGKPIRFSVQDLVPLCQ